MKRQYGLIGYPLSHSFSKGYFAKKFEVEGILDCHYESYPIEDIEQFKNLIATTENLVGLNVTIPYKQQVMSYLDEINPEALAIGAVNTIKIKGGKLIGYNTDVYGFTQSLLPMLNGNNEISALILGTGGAAKAVAYSLEQLAIPFQYVSRSEQHNYISYEQLNLEKVSNSKLIINTTPLGMYPNIDDAPPIAFGGVGNEHILFDLVYNPKETLFLRKGKDRGASIKNGLEMLHLQAEKSWEIWNT